MNTKINEMASTDHDCCAFKAAGSGNATAVGWWVRARRYSSELAKWLLLGVILAVLPKCPLCVMAYVTVATGIGISFSTAATARILIIAACITVLAYVVAKYIYRMIVTPSRRLF